MSCHALLQRIFPTQRWNPSLLHCRQITVIVNSTAMNSTIHIFLWIMFFFGYMPRSGIAGSYVSCESWTIRKAEHQRIDAFRLWFWRRLLRVPNQSILKKINPEYLLEGLFLKLKLQYFGRLMQRAKSLEKTLTLGKIESKRRG